MQPVTEASLSKQARSAPAWALAWQRRLWITLAAVLVLVGALSAPKLFRKALPVRGVERGTALEAVYCTGTLESLDDLRIKAQLGGTIAQLAVAEGAQVAAGDLLVVIAAPTREQDVIRAEAELRAARTRSQARAAALRAEERVLQARLGQARLELTRAEETAQLGASAGQDLERTRLQLSLLEGQAAANQARQAELAVDAEKDSVGAETSLTSTREQARAAEVRTPIAGVVLERLVERGELVEPNQSLFRVGSTGLRVEAVVDERDIGKVHEGCDAAVRVAALADRTLRARVSRVSAAASADSHSFHLQLELLDTADTLRPGMTIEGNIVVAAHSGALLVPTSALHGDHVWIMSRDGRAHPRKVEIGLRDIERVEVTAGLAQDEDLIIVSDDRALHDGDAVVISERLPGHNESAARAGVP